jgi:tetratricopeptide (TPR) repeat protein
LTQGSGGWKRLATVQIAWFFLFPSPCPLPGSAGGQEGGQFLGNRYKSLTANPGWVWPNGDAMVKTILAMLLLTLSWGCGGDGAEKYMQAGFANFQQQKYDEAIANYEQVLKLQPRAAAAYNMIGMAYRFKYNQLGVPEFRQKEIAAFQKAIEVDPNNWVSMINLATDYYADGQKGKAALLLKKALALHPDHPEQPALEKMIAAGERQP